MNFGKSKCLYSCTRFDIGTMLCLDVCVCVLSTGFASVCSCYCSPSRKATSKPILNGQSGVITWVLCFNSECCFHHSSQPVLLHLATQSHGEINSQTDFRCRTTLVTNHRQVTWNLVPNKWLNQVLGHLQNNQISPKTRTWT